MPVALCLFASTPDITNLGFIVRVLTGSIDDLPARAVEWGYDGIEFMPDPENVPEPAAMERALQAAGAVMPVVNSGRMGVQQLALLHADAGVRGRSMAAFKRMLRGETGGCSPRWIRPQPGRHHPASPLPQLVRKGPAIDSRRDLQGQHRSLGHVQPLPKGHQIRLEISSSNFPRYDRNLNTGEDLLTGKRMVEVNQAVYHDRDHPSAVMLPVVPR